jgi:quaternary ammonium compound-resistance protein SugE
MNRELNVEADRWRNRSRRGFPSDDPIRRLGEVAHMNAWALLLIAGLFEIGWAIGLEYAEGFTEFLPSVATVAALLASMLLLARAVETLPIGTAYAVWTGIGAVGTATLGVLLFDEPASLARAGFVSLIVVGIVGLNLTGH